MDIHYNAFISYRHHPDDIRVASEIHRLLERFPVPKSLRKKTGKIERIFRDKEELPITSNLTDDISAALRNSDYLIVICSVHTKESIWVQREIETFLKTHSRNRVLTVLCSGEPYDVIPEILLYEEVEDPITGEMIRRDVEPLSCDWRVSPKQARREELPRLAAVLLGCGYDDLRQRQRHYRMQRLLTAMAVAAALSLGFAAYFLYTSITIQRANVQIQANLEEALRNQSRFLSNAAQERLDSGDRLTAIALAVEALPKYPGERPYVPEAEDVLSNALGVYMDEKITAVGAMGRGTAASLRDFWVAQNQPVCVIQDDRGVLTTWDTNTMEKIATLSVEPSTAERVLFTEKGTILVLAGDRGKRIYAVTADGTLLWEQGPFVDAAYLSDNTLLLLCGEDGSYHLRYADPETGEECAPRVELPVLDADMTPTKLLAGGRTRADAVALHYSTWGERAAVVVRPESGETMTALRNVQLISCAGVTEDGKLLVMAIVDTFSNAGSVSGNRVTAPQEYVIFCCDQESGGILWQQDLLTYFHSGCNQIMQIPGQETVMGVSGNTIQIMDLESGEVVYRCETGTGILAMQTDSDSAFYILQDGYVGILEFRENETLEVPYMEGNLAQAEIFRGLYGLEKNGGQVTLYRTTGRENLWTAPVNETGYFTDERIHGDLMASVSGVHLSMFSLSRQESLWSRECGYGDILGFSQDGSVIWVLNSGMELVAYDTGDGSSKVTQLPREIDGQYYSTGYGNGLNDDCLYYLVCNEKQANLMCWDLMTEELRILPLPGDLFPLENYVLMDAQLLGCTDGFAWIRVEGQLYGVDCADGTVWPVLNSTEPIRLICRDEDKAVFAAGGMVYGYHGVEPLFVLKQEGTQACSAALREEDLFVLSDNGRVYQYDYSGTLLWEAEVEVYNTFANNAQYAEEWEFGWYFLEDNRLMVNVLGVATVLDYGNRGICAGIVGVVGFDGENNQLILKSGGDLSACSLYETEQLLQIAREQLNGYSLSEEERRYYGIG